MSYRICKDEFNDPVKETEKLVAIFAEFAMKI
jgi:hypothetical protein